MSVESDKNTVYNNNFLLKMCTFIMLFFVAFMLIATVAGIKNNQIKNEFEISKQKTKQDSIKLEILKLQKQ